MKSIAFDSYVVLTYSLRDLFNLHIHLGNAYV